MHKVVQHAMTGSLCDLSNILESAGQLSDFLQVAKRAMYDEPQLLRTSEAARHLLNKALEFETFIDLGPLDLPAEHVLLVVELAAKSGCVPELSLSGMCELTERHLSAILNVIPQLHTLHVFGTDQIPLSSKLDLVRASQIKELNDSKLFSLPFLTGIYHKGSKFEPTEIRPRNLYCYSKDRLHR